jgi:hypothetical protein
MKQMKSRSGDNIYDGGEKRTLTKASDNDLSFAAVNYKKGL